MKSVKLKPRPSFFRRHNRLLAVAGMIIALLTFVVNEIFRDKLHNLQQSITETQRVEDIEDAAGTTGTENISVSLRIQQLKDMLATAQNQDVTANDLQEDIGDLSMAYTNAEAYFDRISNMLDQLPDKVQSLQEKRTSLKKDLTKLQADVQDTTKECLTVKKPRVAHRILVLAELINIEVFDLKLALWEDGVATTAKNIQRVAERTYRLCTLTFYALYVIGWTLGLAGLLLGSKKEPDQR